MEYTDGKIISDIASSGLLAAILAWFMFHYEKLVKRLTEIHSEGIRTQQKMSDLLENICKQLESKK